MTEQTATRKPTAAQRRAMTAAAAADGHLPYPGNTLMYRRIVEAGWAATVSQNTPRLTRAGYMAIGQAQAELIAAAPAIGTLLASRPTVAPESFNTPDGVLDGPAAVAMRDRLLLADVPVPPFAVGDRVTWGRADTPDGLRVWHVTRVWRGDDGGWSVAARLAGGTGETSTAAPAAQFHALPAMPAEHRVFTFGYAHTHPDLPAGALTADGAHHLGKNFVRIPGDTESARARMLALFGRGWAFDYAPERFEPQIERYGLVEVAPPSFLAGMTELYADDGELRAWVIEQLGSQQLDGLATDLRYGPA